MISLPCLSVSLNVSLVSCWYFAADITAGVLVPSLVDCLLAKVTGSRYGRRITLTRDGWEDEGGVLSFISFILFFFFPLSQFI